MKVLAILGSPRKLSASETIVNEVLKGVESVGAEVNKIKLKDLEIKTCKSCMYCRSNNGCATKDGMQRVYDAIDDADAIVIGAPIYMLQMNAQTKLFQDRLYPYLNDDFTSKVSKKTVLVYTHGAPDKGSFVDYMQHSAQAYSVLGFPVSKIIVGAGLNNPGLIIDQTDLLAEAFSAGKQLLS